MNLIKQIVRPGEYGTQTIKMVVKSSERGAQGEKGEKGDSATITAGNAYSVEEGQSPAVINTGTSSDAVFDFYIPKGPKGDDGAIQYTAGTNIAISGNTISATIPTATNLVLGGIKIAEPFGVQLSDSGELKAKVYGSSDYQSMWNDAFVSKGTMDYALGNKQNTLTAGTGINITSGNVIEATGDATAAWGGIQGDIVDQTDLQNEFGLYTKTADLPNLSTAYVGTNNLVDGAVATAKIADGAVTTAKINDGSVTASKFAQYAVNNAIITANNLTPTADTPSAWINLLGGTDGAFPAGKGGYFFGYYNVVDSFTNQPSQYGWLETIVEGSGIYQRWADHANGPVYYRLGNQHGWEGVSAGSGSFKVLLDRKTVHTTAGTLIPASSDLNTLDFIQPGEYRCGYANVSTLNNCPTDTAFKMATNNIMGGGTAVSTSSTWIYLNREITDIDGRVWTQTVTSDGNSPVTWTYGVWHMVSGGNRDGAIRRSNFLTMNNGYTADYFYAYKTGKLVYLNLGVHKSSGNFGGSNESVATIKPVYIPIYDVNADCALISGGVYGAKAIGQLYITAGQSGAISVSDQNGTNSYNYAKICLTYPIA